MRGRKREEDEGEENADKEGGGERDERAFKEAENKGDKQKADEEDEEEEGGN